MPFLISVDDTDMPDTIGTGRLVQDLCRELETLTMGTCSAISRHQLFVHEDIPYTSHNSAMCFEFSLALEEISPVISHVQKFLTNRSARGSDPGLCVADMDKTLDWEVLIRFGRQAKTRVLTKTHAYGLAQTLGIHLSEHGGTGCGVIGALAGAGLRFSGDDGRYRGWYHLGRPGEVIGVDHLCRLPFIEALVTEDGDVLALDCRVAIGSEKTKTVRLDHRQVVVVTPNEEAVKSGVLYRTISKKEAKAY